MKTLEQVNHGKQQEKQHHNNNPNSVINLLNKPTDIPTDFVFVTFSSPK